MPLVHCPDCHSDVSVQALACPRCGRPMQTPPTNSIKSSKKMSPILIGCLGLLGIFFLIGLVSLVFSGSPSNSTSAPSSDSASTDLRNRATSKLLATNDWSNSIAIARLCEQADVGRLTSAVKSHCASTHLASAREKLSARNAVEARRSLTLAVAEGASERDRESIEAPLKKLEASEARKKQQIEAAAATIVRQEYGKRLRQKYLDDNLDINVRVSGKNSDHITLEFALFNAVWANKVQKGELLDEMRKLGFKRMDMTDNYNYHVYWNLK
jgi:hypothetical protein